jgi:alpha/beta superfamily hydrolase
MAAASQCRIEHRIIQGANHYYFGQPELVQQAAETVRDWLAAQG